MGITVPHVVVIFIAAVASITDVRTSRIPNWLTLGAALIAVPYAFAADGVWGGLHAVEGWTVGVLLFLPFFLLGGLGAGDVQLVSAIGAWLGPGQAFWVAGYGSIVGGFMAVVVALVRGYLGQALANLRLLLMHWRVVGIGPVQELSLENSRAPRLAYALPIAAGVMVTLWLT